MFATGPVLVFVFAPAFVFVFVFVYRNRSDVRPPCCAAEGCWEKGEWQGEIKTNATAATITACTVISTAEHIMWS